MFSQLLSGDLPRSRLLTLVLVAIVAGLALAPFLFPGAKAINVAAKICVFIVLVASYDLLLGYTGIVSFAHTMFFGIGAYGVAIALTRLGASWTAVGAGIAAALALSFVLSLVIGLFSLRVKALFYAMITLAVASAFQTLASQLSEFTGGEDGLNFKVPEMLSPAFSLSEQPFLGVSLDGKLISYYSLFALGVVLFLVMLRIVNSPFGRVLQAIRENAFRAEALGYPLVVYRTWSNVLSAGFATLAGALLALVAALQRPRHFAFLRHHDRHPADGCDRRHGNHVWSGARRDAVHRGAELPAGPDELASSAAAGVPLLANLVHPDRWLLWLGILFIVSVYRFPAGIVGKLRAKVRGKP